MRRGSLIFLLFATACIVTVGIASLSRIHILQQHRIGTFNAASYQAFPSWTWSLADSVYRLTGVGHSVLHYLRLLVIVCSELHVCLQLVKLHVL